MIFIECYSDEVLVKALGIKRKDIKHDYSKGNVCNSLLKSFDSIGITDEDPSVSQPNYMKNLQKDESYILQNLILYRDNSSRNILVLICPNLEVWILKIVEENNIDILKYYLPNTEEGLHSIGMNEKKLLNLKKLILDLKQVSKKLKVLKNLLHDKE